MLLTALVLHATLQQTQDKSVFRDPKLGLQFEYPKQWKMRKERTYGLFEIPLKDGKTASVQVFNAKFKGQADEWQLIQAEINRSMKRTVDRQWKEEYLGVPMLLTQVSYNDGDVATIAQVGLLYTSFEEKMHYRLTSPSSDTEEATEAWKDALLSLRTISGDLPAAEDPNKPSVKPEKPKTTSIWKAESKPAKIERGAITLDYAQADTKFKVYLPKDWSLVDGKLAHKGMAGTLTFSATVGLPEDAGSRLLNDAKGSLDRFTSIRVREDPKPLLAKSGAIVGRVFREGAGKSGALVAGNVVGYCEGVFWSVSYECDDPKAFQKDKLVLTELWQLLYAERE
ncbi:MAG: hypothetical protein JSS66_00290 [Armatimonadetes bacterium]|nr:hypothetical protein [Armatimonadota bacterium]